jgi:methionine sulfoxide reductase heme-binding subunit
MLGTLRSWRLFWALTAAISIANVFNIARSDFSSFEGSQAAVVRTMWYAQPCLVAAFLASSLVRLRSTVLTRWLVANRRYVGLAFFAGMVWHLSVVSYFLFKFGNHLEVWDLSLDICGLIFLLAMTLTSFSPFRTKISAISWRRLHKTGIYVLWVLPTFFFIEDYFTDHAPLYAAAAGVLLTALAVRIVGRIASKKRTHVTNPLDVDPHRAPNR